MAWQKKHSNKTFAGDFGCMLRQKKTFLRQEKGQQHIRSCDVSLAHMELLLDGRLNEYLHEIDEACYEMRDRLVEKMKEKQGVTEQLKAENQMMWVGKMNNIIACAEEVMVREVVYV